MATVALDLREDLSAPFQNTKLEGAIGARGSHAVSILQRFGLRRVDRLIRALDCAVRKLMGLILGVGGRMLFRTERSSSGKPIAIYGLQSGKEHPGIQI